MTQNPSNIYDIFINHFIKFAELVEWSSTNRQKTNHNAVSVSQQELPVLYNKHELRKKLDEFLIFGSYPETITSGKKDIRTEY